MPKKELGLYELVLLLKFTTVEDTTRKKIDFYKIDVQGFESIIIENGSKTISIMGYRRPMLLRPCKLLSKVCKKHLLIATANHLGKKSAISAPLQSLIFCKQPMPTWTRLLKIAATTQLIL